MVPVPPSGMALSTLDCGRGLRSCGCEISVPALRPKLANAGWGDWALAWARVPRTNITSGSPTISHLGTCARVRVSFPASHLLSRRDVRGFRTNTVLWTEQHHMVVLCEANAIVRSESRIHRSRCTLPSRIIGSKIFVPSTSVSCLRRTRSLLPTGHSSKTAGTVPTG